ncbi:uncharacterized protein LOC135217157 [Macrobrachium nipponense]|uniref:uncharacterized protein LOC135217157 n=1 Tax=Macrobrachium nipponense TaxID=159736 RepID=UPI0030C82804
MMRYTLSLLLAIAVSWARAQDAFFEKYTYAKTMSECFGNSAYEEYLLRIANAKRECGYNPVNFYEPRPTYDDRRYPNTGQTNRPFFTTPTAPPINFQGGYPSTFSSYTPFKGNTPDISGNGFALNFLNKPTGKQTLRRFSYSQRQLYDSEAIQMALRQIGDSLRNFTCVFGQLRLIDQRLNIDYDTMINNYYNSQIDNQLREDLISGINYCRELVSCMPEDKSPVSFELQRLMAFARCERKTRLSACLRRDLRNNLQHFDVSALPDDGQRTSDIEKLLTILVGQESLDQLELY